MKMEVYYFSGTGNTFYIAEKMAKHFEGSEIISISNLDVTKTIRSEADVVGIIYPVYFYNAPEIVKKFTETLELSSHSYLFLCENYGAGGGNSLLNCAKTLEERNIKVDHTFSVALPDNSIIFPTKEEKIPLMLQEGNASIEEMIREIEAQKKSDLPKKKLIANTIGKTMKGLCKSYLGFTDMKVDSNKCNECGLCARVCPMNNIELYGNQPIFKDRCEMCFGCIHYCPKQAIRFRRMKVTENYQYTNPNISVEKIIEKNNRIN